MKIAAVSIGFNEEFRLTKWKEYYNEYKDELYKHIIIDNASNANFVMLLKESFPESLLIERNINGGCTGAYNDGIRAALSDPEVDAILLIGNDIKMPSSNLTTLYNYLYSDDELGMVSPVVLQKDSNLVESYGATYTIFNDMRLNDRGQSIEQIMEDERYVDLVPGGMNIAKRSFYERVGLQDENLFMYCDESDMHCRAKKAGIKIGATKKSVTWHQHVNPGFRMNRSTNAAFFTGRNLMYLAKKHENRSKLIVLFFYYYCRTFLSIIKNIKSKDAIVFKLHMLKGLWNGLTKKNNNNFIFK